jgi:CheY-like chemotaxis protein
MNLAVSIPLEHLPRMTANLLLIDDNAVQAATRQTILKRAGYFVIAVLNPARALEQFQRGEFPAEINLVITDHLMPGFAQDASAATGAGDQRAGRGGTRVQGAGCDVSHETAAAGSSARDGGKSDWRG